MVLDAEDAAGILVVLDVGGDNAVDLDFDVVAFAGDAVGVPVVALEGLSSAFEEGGFAFFVATLGTDEPLAASFIVKAAGPVARAAIDFGLVAEDFVGLGVSPEHEAAVGRSLGQEDFALKNEVGVFLFGDEEEFLVSSEVKLAINDFDFAPLVGIGPAGECLAIGERSEAVFVLCEERTGYCDAGENDCM